MEREFWILEEALQDASGRGGSVIEITTKQYYHNHSMHAYLLLSVQPNLRNGTSDRARPIAPVHWSGPDSLDVVLGLTFLA